MRTEAGGHHGVGTQERPDVRCLARGFGSGDLRLPTASPVADERRGLRFPPETRQKTSLLSARGTTRQHRRVCMDVYVVYSAALFV